ncbi:MAG: branched-chain amino acid ABC transporter permease [Candidatus Woesearchaeota archaeon]|nr:branched-chain amino acid ABC transporter permease [Candidatus Woesearchaeota archaeon]
MNAYVIHLFIMLCIYIVLTTSMNLAVGFTGLINLGHIAFYAIGAYTSALLAVKLGLPFWVGLLAGGCMAAFFGYLLSFPTVRLKGDYLAIGTLGFSIILEAVLKNWTSLTRGPLGIPGIPKPELFGLTFSSLELYAILAFTLALITFTVLKIVTVSPFGRVMKAVRDDEVAAKTLGKNTFRVKAKVLTLSAFFAGVAGSLYAHYITFIDPTSFAITETILIFSMVLVGGTGSLWGSIAGAFVIGILLPEPLRFLDLPSSIVGGMRQALYALLMILVIMKRPQGLIGEDTFHSMWHNVKRRFKFA